MAVMRLKIVSLNLYEGGLLFDRVLAFLQKENPDIILLQEVNNGTDRKLPPHFRSLQVLKEAFTGYHASFAPEFLCNYKEGKIDIGNAIFSHYPITNSTVTALNAPYGEYSSVPVGGDFSKHPKNIQWCEITVHNEPINVFNLHGLWELSGGDTPERLKMSEIILNEVKGKPRVILGGDFNIKPKTKTIHAIEKKLTNVFKNELKTTFNVSRKDLTRFPGYSSAVVDMIFISNDIKVLEKSCPTIDISDHLPLICELEV